jgi:hypothetical protein
MTDTTATTVTPDPRVIARAVLLEVADEPEQVGDFITANELEDHVTDFRFSSSVLGFEGWQWSVTLYHDEELDSWTVDESSLIPTDDALMPPKWIPWKDRLEPADLSPTDSIGTDPQDERLENGEVKESSLEDVNEAVEDFHLTRRHVLTSLGRAQAAKRWYDGPRGPKALSTKTAEGNLCSTCGFFMPLQGELDRLFGVCANKWSPDDGRVVSLDHGCGEHSEIEPPELNSLWVQSKPAFDDLHIDVVAHSAHSREAVAQGGADDLDENAEAGDATGDIIPKDIPGEKADGGSANPRHSRKSRRTPIARLYLSSDAENVDDGVAGGSGIESAGIDGAAVIGSAAISDAPDEPDVPDALSGVAAADSGIDDTVGIDGGDADIDDDAHDDADIDETDETAETDELDDIDSDDIDSDDIDSDEATEEDILDNTEVDDDDDSDDESMPVILEPVEDEVAPGLEAVVDLIEKLRMNKSEIDDSDESDDVDELDDTDDVDDSDDSDDTDDVDDVDDTDHADDTVSGS